MAKVEKFYRVMELDHDTETIREYAYKNTVPFKWCTFDTVEEAEREIERAIALRIEDKPYPYDSIEFVILTAYRMR